MLWEKINLHYIILIVQIKKQCLKQDFVGGTIAEDVITGGGGIADDAASFYLAYRLMFGL